MKKIEQRGKQDLRIGDWLSEIEKVSGVPIKKSFVVGTAVLLIDCSGSMDGEKILLARKGAIDYGVEAAARNYNVGIVKFSSDAEVVYAPSAWDKASEKKIADIVPSGSTNMKDGILVAWKILGGTIGAKFICIVTDGMPNDREGAIEAAIRAKQSGVEIVTIGTDDADKKFLSDIASRRDFSFKVSSSLLDVAIADSAKMLPYKK